MDTLEVQVVPKPRRDSRVQGVLYSFMNDAGKLKAEGGPNIVILVLPGSYFLLLSSLGCVSSGEGPCELGVPNAGLHEALSSGGMPPRSATTSLVSSSETQEAHIGPAGSPLLKSPGYLLST